jgi:hypothetical protein
LKGFVQKFMGIGGSDIQPANYPRGLLEQFHQGVCVVFRALWVSSPPGVPVFYTCRATGAARHSAGGKGVRESSLPLIPSTGL